MARRTTMIRVMLLDLGETLVHNDVLFPHVREALTALRSFKTPNGEPLAMCLVSDFQMPTPPVTQEKVFAIFQEYVAILDRLGLISFFEPVDRFVTLSTHAGIFKPAPHIFEVALQRARIHTQFDQCLFVTENAAHTSVCRAMGMQTLRFAAPSTPGADYADFTDWCDAPLLVARRVNPSDTANLETALKVHLAATHEISAQSFEYQSNGDLIRVHGRKWVPISAPSLGDLIGIHVELPVNIQVRVNPQGNVESVDSAEPSPEVIKEATASLSTLVSNQQITRPGEPRAFGATHAVEVAADGRRYLKRKRFTAV